MLTSVNYILLIFLGIVSCILLCFLNADQKHIMYESEPENSDNTETSNDLKWTMQNLISSNTLLYSLCALFGVFIIANVIKNKLKVLQLYEPLAVLEERLNKLKLEVCRLKTEKCNFVSVLRQYKLEKKFLIQNINFNSAIIRKLKTELKTAKSKITLLKCKIHNISNEKSVDQSYSLYQETASTCTLSSYIVNHYFRPPDITSCEQSIEECDTLKLTVSNHNVINKILKEAYNRREAINQAHFTCEEIMCSPSEHTYQKIQALPEITRAIKEDYNYNRKEIYKQMHNVNVVSTDQLEVIKGIYNKDQLRNAFKIMN